MGVDSADGLGLGRLRALAGQAKAGQLSLDPSVASDCAAACDKLIADLTAIRRKGDVLKVGMSLGDFECGNSLSRTLQVVAAGDGGLLPRLDEHIEAVTQIRYMVRASVAAVQDSDSHTSTAVNTVGSEIG